MFNPSHPGDLIQESLDGLREETGQLLPLTDVGNAGRIGPAQLLFLAHNVSNCCSAWS